MITVEVGNLLESSAQTLVNTVNTVGVMGKGIALEFKKRFPAMHRDYVTRCERGEVRLGRPYVYRVRAPSSDLFGAQGERAEGPELIINFPTKDHWRSVSRITDIGEGLRFLVDHYREWGVTSIAVPPLGCGNGQLEWRVVGRTLYRFLKQLDIPVELYAPHHTPAEQLGARFLAGGNGGTEEPAPRLEPAWIALAAIVDRIQQEPYHWPVGRTTFQKIAYFATAAGLPTGLQYRRGSYGPFSSELKSVLVKLVNNGVVRERKLGRMLSVEAGPTYRDAMRSFRPQLEEWAALVDRIADLFLRMQTRDAEVAAAALFVAEELRRDRAEPSEADVLDEIKRWKVRRRPGLPDEDVAAAIRNLNILRWVQLTPSDTLPLPQDA